MIALSVSAGSLFSWHLRSQYPARRFIWLCCLLGLVLAACRADAGTEGPVASIKPLSLTSSPPVSSAVTILPGSGTVPPPATPGPEVLGQAGISKAVTPTPNPYIGLRIPDLMTRPYGGGEIQVHELMEAADGFLRYLISYPSDGIEIYGFMNVPGGAGPFPVVVALHGYIDPSEYQTLDYTTRYADTLSRAGFIVVHPNLRGYRPSGNGPNEFRVGMAVDVLNLIAIIRENGGRPGPLAQADPDQIGLWGHSMGGGITLRVLTVSEHVGAAVLYGSMTADERVNYQMIATWSEGQRGAYELAAPDEALREISPLYFLHQIRAPVSVHHGEADDLIPVSRSLELCRQLEALAVRVNCYTYPDESHTFFGFGDYQFNQRAIEFFSQELREAN